MRYWGHSWNIMPLVLTGVHELPKECATVVHLWVPSKYKFKVVMVSLFGKWKLIVV